MNPSASDYLAWIGASLAEDVLPHLADPSARAAAGSAIQVLQQLSVTVAWDPAPLAERLAVRQKVMAELASLAADPGSELPAVPACALAHEKPDAASLESAIVACDAHATLLVTIAKSLPALEPWLLRYCAAAASIDLRFMAPSHLGKLTRKGPSPTRTST